MITNKFEEQVFFTTTRITIPNKTGDNVSIGTGFLVQMPLDDGTGRNLLLLVSNKHVFVDPGNKIEFIFNKQTETGEPDFGNIQKFTGDDFSSIYTEHPSPEIDLACINASIIGNTESKIYHKAITPELFADFNEDLLIPGLEVLFLGYPDNRYDVHNNLPLLRKGYIASLPKIDFNNKKQFVIDAQVFQGSSGSPVFTTIQGKFRFIGVVTETMIKNGELMTIPTSGVGLGVQQILGLGLVIKGTQVRELVNIALDKVKKVLQAAAEATR